MRPGTWDGATSTDNVRVTVNGTRRPVKDVRIQSGMRDGHPQAESGSWCVEATIEWEDPALVTRDSPHLFGQAPIAGSNIRGATDWLPRAGDRVVIETGDGARGQWWVQHRGVIDDTTGSIAEGTAKSTTVDNIEDLSGRVQFSALLHRMTPWSDNHDYRNIGLSSIYMVDRMWRNPQTQDVGWYATPPMTWQTVGSAPMNGSCQPEAGTLRICGRSSTQTNSQIYGWRDTSYGVAPVGVYAEYLLTQTVTNQAIITVSAESSPSGVVRYRLHDVRGYGAFIRIRGDTRVIQYGIETSGTSQWEMPLGNATRVAMYLRRDSTSSQTVIIRTDDGREETRTGHSTVLPFGNLDRFYVGTSETGMAGWWIVEDGEKPASQRWFTLDHKPTARLRREADVRWLASRDLPFTMPSEWLAEQVDAECAAMWLDEDNHMQWAARGALEKQSPVRTITSGLDVDDIQWEQRRAHMARSVWVNYKTPNVRSLLGGFRQNCYENDGIDLAPGEEEYVAVAIPDDEDWIGIDLNSSIMTPAMAPVHLRMGSKHGGTMYEETSSGEAGQTWAQFVDYSITRTGLRSLELYYAPWRTMSSRMRVKSAIPDITKVSSNISAWHSGNAAVRVRSRGKTTWIEGERSLPAGDVGPARYTHDVDWRVQNMHIVDGVGELLSWLRTQVRDTTRPRVTGLTIAHDPRLQVGDKIRIRDTEVTGADFDMLIQQRDVNVGDFTEAIEGRVTLARAEWIHGGSAPAESRLEPGGATPITPDADWTRDEVA